MSVNTRELVVEEGGFLYDSDCYNDDLPYWSRVLGRPHLVVPYGLVVNDARYVPGNGFASPEHFYEMAKAHLDRLRNDGDDVSRMMSIGLHPRITGNPARADALARFIDYAQSLGDVWFARRIDIARTFVEQQPAETVAGGELSSEPASGDELVSLVTCDLAGLVRGRSVPACRPRPASRDRRRLGAGEPVDLGVRRPRRAEPVGLGRRRAAAARPGDARARRPLARRSRRCISCSATSPRSTAATGSAAAARSCGARSSGLQRHAGRAAARLVRARVRARVARAAAHPPSRSRRSARRSRSRSQVMARAARRPGVEPESFLPEYGEHQFEIPVAPAEGVAAADRSVVLQGGRARGRAPRRPARDVRAAARPRRGVGNGVHIHLSLLDADGRPVLLRRRRARARSRELGGRFAAGILRHLPARARADRAEPASRARASRRTAGAPAPSCLGEQNREALLRIPPARAARRHDGRGPAAPRVPRAPTRPPSPYLALGALVRAGLEGIRDGLEPPPVARVRPARRLEAERYGAARCRARSRRRSRRSSAIALARAWLPPRLLDTYVGLKRAELVARRRASTLEEVCRLYAAIH